jgi:hypothetical protein
MTGLFFERIEGYLRVEFAHVRWDDIAITFHLHGDGTIQTPCNENFEKGTPEVLFADDLTVYAYTSPATSAFFQSMVQWLEAVIIGVEECAFRWEGEGPEGELRWWNNGTDSGQLQLQWDGSRTSAPAHYRILLNRSQAVRAFYQSFRAFVESNRYDPLVYEELRNGEVFGLILDDGDVGALADALVARNRLGAYRLLLVLLDRAYNQVAGPSRRLALADYLAQADRLAELPEDEEHVTCWLPPDWDGWTLEQRRKHVLDGMYQGDMALGLGEHLRELRSPMVEQWLEQQADSAKPGASAPRSASDPRRTPLGADLPRGGEGNRAPER